MITESQKEEALYIAIVKGLTCNGVREWQTITLKDGSQVAMRFGGME